MCELTVISRNEVNKVFCILCSINLVVTRDAVSRPTTHNVLKCHVLMRGRCDVWPWLIDSGAVPN